MKKHQLPEFLYNSTVIEIFNYVSVDLERHLGIYEERSIDNIPIRAEFINLESDEDFFSSEQSPTYIALHSSKSKDGSLTIIGDKGYKPLSTTYLLSAIFTKKYDGSIQMTGELTHEIQGFSQEYLNIERNSYDGFDIAA